MPAPPAPPAPRASPGSVTTATIRAGLLFDDRASLSMLITVVPEAKIPSLARAPAPAGGPARGLLRHPHPRDRPRLLPLSDLPAPVDGDLVGGRQHPDGGPGFQRGRSRGRRRSLPATTARSARSCAGHCRSQLGPARPLHRTRSTAPRTRSKRPQPGDSQAGRDAAGHAARSNAASPVTARRRGQQWARKSVSTRGEPVV
jgi:hypothetical protein